MLMAEVQDQLQARGLPRLTPNAIRFAEDRGHIPKAPRDWRGFRVFGNEHVEALAAYIGKRQQPAKAS
jgi:DNA-binding transcriptional MerR regulator